MSTHSPTNFQCRLSAFNNLINKTIIDRPSERHRSILFEHLELYDMQSGRSVCPVPDLLFYKRETEWRVRLSIRRGTPLLPISPNTATLFFMELVTKMLEEKMLSIRFHNFPEHKLLSSKCSWPWNFAHEFNKLPSYLRAAITEKNFKTKNKRYFKAAHPHVHQSVECPALCRAKALTLPPDALDFNSLRLNDPKISAEAKARIRLEQEIFTYTSHEKADTLLEAVLISTLNYNEARVIRDMYQESEVTLDEFIFMLYNFPIFSGRLFQKDMARQISHLSQQ